MIDMLNWQTATINITKTYTPLSWVSVINSYIFLVAEFTLSVIQYICTSHDHLVVVVVVVVVVKSKVWPISHWLELGPNTLPCAVCLVMFLSMQSRFLNKILLMSQRICIAFRNHFVNIRHLHSFLTHSYSRFVLSRAPAVDKALIRMCW